MSRKEKRPGLQEQTEASEQFNNEGNHMNGNDSNTGLQVFNFQTNQLRVIVKDGEPWFVAGDVCAALGLGNQAMALGRLDDDEKGVSSTDTLGGPQQVAVVNEPGLYGLVLGSRKPEAKMFKRWVKHEVLPSIRKTGSYGTPSVDPMQALNDPATMRGLLLTYSEKVITLEAKVAAQSQVVLAHDRIAGADGSVCMTVAAKDLQVRPIDLRNLMVTRRWIYGKPGREGWTAYQDKIQTGYLVHKTEPVKSRDGSDKLAHQVRVTPKGLTKLAELINEGAIAKVAA